MQIIFLARVAEERGDFDLDDVLKSVGDKIVRRHPHVFGDGRLTTADQVLAQWETIKAAERKGNRDGSLLAGVPKTLPALLKAFRISSKAGRVGFGWTSLDGLLRKMDEEIGELRSALRSRRRPAIAEELGDLLFTLANVGRHVGIDPEAARQSANRQFVGRFRYVEERLNQDGLSPAAEN